MTSLTRRSFWISSEMYCYSFDIVSDCFPRVSRGWEAHFFLLLKPTAPQTHGENFCFLQISLMGKNKNLLNEDTSKEDSVADIDHILLGPQHAAGSALLQLSAFFFTAYIRFSFPRTACCLAVSSLRGWTAPACCLSILESGEKNGRLPSDSLRYQPPIVQEHGDSREDRM